MNVTLNKYVSLSVYSRKQKSHRKQQNKQQKKEHKYQYQSIKTIKRGGFHDEEDMKLTQNQKQLMRSLNHNVRDSDSKLVFVTGPAGTGKTMLTCKKAFEKLNHNDVDKIVITRPLVTVDEDLGFLPGGIDDKMDPWTKPIFDYMEEVYNKSEIDYLLKNKIVDICPLAFMRGRTFKNCFVIADEMQNSTNNQMKMLLTRIGDNSIFAITGDLNQNDVEHNGLQDFITRHEQHVYDSCENDMHAIIDDAEHLDFMVEYEKSSFDKELSNITHIQFSPCDIKRSPLVKEVLEIYGE